jgi:hypothetical protein
MTLDRLRELLITAQNRLLRARTTTIVGADTPAARAVDAARAGLVDLIKFVEGDSSVRIAHVGRTLQGLCTALAPFNTDPDLNSARTDLLEAEMLVADTTYDA